MNYQHYCDDNNHCLISKKNVKVVTDTVVTTTTTTTVEEKYKVISSDESNYYYIFIFQINLNFLLKVLAPESMQETFMSDSEDEGGRFISWNLIFSS